ncbi:MAG: hypothetical protein RIG61_13890 [Deltaproteobacteria bacterium]
MGYICDSDKPVVLSSSSIGNVSVCGCCDFYHVSVGHIMLRLERKYLLSLTHMVIEALEVSSAGDRDLKNYEKNRT